MTPFVLVKQLRESLQHNQIRHSNANSDAEGSAERGDHLFAEELDRSERRKIFVVGRMFAGDTMTARAEGIFISMRPNQFADLSAARDTRRPN